jgi:hypothetical protein
MSQSKLSWASGFSSSASEIGLISSSANLRAVICQARCSLLREKSMEVNPSLVPGAAQHAVVRCRPGTPVVQRKLGPGSAVHRVELHRVRDTRRGAGAWLLYSAASIEGPGR